MARGAANQGVLGGTTADNLDLLGYKSRTEIGGADWVWCYVPSNMRREALTMMMMTWTEWSIAQRWAWGGPINDIVH